MYWLLCPLIGWNCGVISARRVMLIDVPATVPPPPVAELASALAGADVGATDAADVGGAAVDAALGADVGDGVADDEQALTSSPAIATTVKSRRGMPNLRCETTPSP